MNQTPIELSADLIALLEAIAAERGVSPDQVIRDALAHQELEPLTKPDASRREQLLALSGIGASGRTDTATEAGELQYPPRTWR